MSQALKVKPPKKNLTLQKVRDEICDIVHKNHIDFHSEVFFFAIGEAHGFY